MKPEVGEIWDWDGNDPCTILVLASFKLSYEEKAWLLRPLYLRGHPLDDEDELLYSSFNKSHWRRVA
jgi:hypothetical protein